MKCIARLAAYGLGVVACTLAAGRASAAVTVFDNLGNTNNGFFGLSFTNWIAERFKADTTNLKLTDVTMRLSTSGTPTYTLSLYSDVANLPGAPVATLFSGVAGSGDVHYATSAFTAPDVNYWIVASVGAGGGTGASWGVTTTLTGTGTGFLPLDANSSNQGTSWTLLNGAVQQMQVIATTPEPGASALLTIATMTALARRRRPMSGR